MLRGLDPLLTPDLLHAVAGMGQGDTITAVDANCPAAATARRLVLLPGTGAPAILNTILTFPPIDDFETNPITLMQIVGEPDAAPGPVRDFIPELSRHAAPPPVATERHAFHRAAAAAFAAVHTGKRRFYGNILPRKGVIPPP